MSKSLDEMSRDELVELFESLGGDMSEFGSGYVRISKLREAVAELLEDADDDSDDSFSTSSMFEFVDEDEAEAAVEPAHSDQWYLSRGLSVPED